MAVDFSSPGCSLQGKTELFVTPVVDKLLPGQVQVHKTRPLKPVTLQLKRLEPTQMFLNINDTKVRRQTLAQRTGWAGLTIGWF